jgi:tRNA A-37 threonylcarbamoyl transferase component Bud32
MDHDAEIDRLRKLLEPRQFEVVKPLASGGMAVLWLLWNEPLQRSEVAKEPRAKYRRDRAFRERFVDEARLAARLKHPNIVTVYHIERDDTRDLLLYRMEYVEGEDLRRFVRRLAAPLNLGQARTVVRAIGRAVARAHREDIIHRDIKPSNVLLENEGGGSVELGNRVKLTDFGIAQALEAVGDDHFSRRMGSVYYMAPEQFDGESGKASDVYAIGVVYYQLLTGQLPFTGASPADIERKHRSELPPLPEELNPRLSLVRDGDVVMQCLEKRPERRYQDATELLDALDELEDHTSDGPVETIPLPAAEGAATPPSFPSRRARTRWPVRRLAVAAGLLLAVLVGAYAGRNHLFRLALGPGTELRWAGWKAEALDAPLGITVFIRPTKPRLGAAWQRLGVVSPEGGAPPPFREWFTSPGRFQVKLSDNYCREVTVPGKAPWFVRQEEPSGRAWLQPTPATFAELYRDPRLVSRKDLRPERVDAYVNAILTPQTLATADSLAQVHQAVQRARQFLDACTSPLAATQTVLEAVDRPVRNLRRAGEYLADGDVLKADPHLNEAQSELTKTSWFRNREDCLLRFHVVLADAAQQIAAARRQAEARLERLDVESTSMRYSFPAMADAVSTYVGLAPARGCFQPIVDRPDAAGIPLVWSDGELKNPSAVTEEAVNAAVESSGLTAPRALTLARDYRAALDRVLGPPPNADPSADHLATVYAALDEAQAHFERALRPPPIGTAHYLSCVFAPRDLRFRAVAAAFWRDVHRKRLRSSASRCLAHARKQIARLEQWDSESRHASPPLYVLDDARTCLQAVTSAHNAPTQPLKQARELLAQCQVLELLAVFRFGHATPDHLDRVRARLAPALADLSAFNTHQSETLQEVQQAAAAIRDAHRRLEACTQANFPAATRYEGTFETVLDTLAAQHGLADSLAKYKGDPVYDGALEPFTALACHDGTAWGGTLPQAGACWLLARAAERAEALDYKAVDRILQDVQAQVPQAGADAAPWTHLLPQEHATALNALARAASLFAPKPQAPDAAVPWDRRLEAAPLLQGLDAVKAASPGGQKVAHGIAAVRSAFHQRLEAERRVRQLEAALDALTAPAPQGTVLPDPEAATPAARRDFEAELAALLDTSGRPRQPYAREDHPQRLRDLVRHRDLLERAVASLPKQIATLDDLAHWRSVLEPTTQRELALAIIERLGRKLGPKGAPEAEEHRDLAVSILGQQEYKRKLDWLRGLAPLPQPKKLLAALEPLLAAMLETTPDGQVQLTDQATPARIAEAHKLARRLAACEDLDPALNQRRKSCAQTLDAVGKHLNAVTQEIQQALADDPAQALALLRKHLVHLPDKTAEQTARAALEALAAADPHDALKRIPTWKERLGADATQSLAQAAAAKLLAQAEARARALTRAPQVDEAAVNAALTDAQRLAARLAEQPLPADATKGLATRLQQLQDRLRHAAQGPPKAAETLAALHERLTALAVERADGTVAPHKTKATPEAVANIERELQKVQQVNTEQAKRLRTLCQKTLDALTRGVRERETAIRAQSKSRPSDALDAAQEWSNVLGQERTRDLVLEAARAGLARARDAARDGAFAQAHKHSQAVARHPALRDHGEGPEVQRILAAARNIAMYCQGQEQLRRGLETIGKQPTEADLRNAVERLAQAQTALEGAGHFQDAPATARQLTAFCEALRGAAAPQQMHAALRALQTQDGLHRGIRDAIDAIAPPLDDPRNCIRQLYRLVQEGDASAVQALFADPEAGQAYAARLEQFLDTATDVAATERHIEVDRKGGHATVRSRYSLRYRLVPQLPTDRSQALVWSLVWRDDRWLVKNWKVVR